MKIDENIALDNRKRHKIKIRFDEKSAIKRRENAIENKRKNSALIKKYVDRISVFARRFSRVKLCIYGNNGQRALIAISKICTVWGVEKREDCVCFWVDGKHLSKIIALLQNLCYDYKIINIGGPAPFAARLLSRVGIGIGIVLVALALSFYLTRLDSISIRLVGEDVAQDSSGYALQGELYAILDEYGVRKGAKINAIDLSAIRDAIMSLDSVAFADVKRAGTCINVTVKSALGSDYVIGVDGSSVCAKKRAVVSRVVVEGGTAVRQYGDVVNEGDVIIDGFIEYGDDKIAVEAHGYAYGRVYYTSTRYFANEQLVVHYGERTTMTRLSLLGKLPTTPQAPYEHYTLKTSVSRLDFLIPFWVYTYEYEQVEWRLCPNELDEEGMKKVVYSSLITELEESAKIENAYYEITKTDSGTVVRLTLEVEERIA